MVTGDRGLVDRQKSRGTETADTTKRKGQLSWEEFVLFLAESRVRGPQDLCSSAGSPTCAGAGRSPPPQLSASQ